MKRLLQSLDTALTEAARVPGLHYAVMVSAVFLFCRNGLVLGFTGHSAELIRTLPDSLGVLVREGGILPAFILAAFKSNSDSALLSIRFLLFGIHAVNTALVYRVSREIFGFNARWSLLCALLFGFAPLNAVSAMVPLNLGAELAFMATLLGALVYINLRYRFVMYFFAVLALSCSPLGVMVFLLYPALDSFLFANAGNSCAYNLKTGLFSAHAGSDTYTDCGAAALRYIALWAGILLLLQGARTVFSVPDVSGLSDMVRRLVSGDLLLLGSSVIPAVSPLLFPLLPKAVRIISALAALALVFAAFRAVLLSHRWRIAGVAACAVLVPYLAGWAGGQNPESETLSYYGAAAAIIWVFAAWLQMQLNRAVSRTVRPVFAGLALVFLLLSVQGFGAAGKIFFSETAYLDSLCKSYPVRDNCNRFARSQLSDGKTSQALYALARAAKMGGSRSARAETAVLAGQAHLMSGHYDKAEKYFRQVLSASPANAQAAEGLAALYKRKKLFGNSIAVLDSGLAASPDNAALLYRKGIVLLDARNYDAAFRSIAAACEQDETYCLFH